VFFDEENNRVAIRLNLRLCFHARRYAVVGGGSLSVDHHALFIGFVE
jgi:hypothetical protein